MVRYNFKTKQSQKELEAELQQNLKKQQLDDALHSQVSKLKVASEQG